MKPDDPNRADADAAVPTTAKVLQLPLHRRPTRQTTLPREVAASPLPARPVATLIAPDVVRLPVWPDPAYRVPNFSLRATLFSAIGRGPRRYLQDELLAVLDDIEIRYTGERLDQGDLDVWETILQLIPSQPSPKPLSAYALLKQQGVSDSGSNRKLLQTRLQRLREGIVTMRDRLCTDRDHLLTHVGRDEAGGAWCITPSVGLRAVYEPRQFTLADLAVRQTLRGQPLAQWLHGYYAGQIDFYPVPIAVLHRFCGSEGRLSGSFRHALRVALAKVQAACGIGAWTIDNRGVVRVEPVPTPHPTRRPRRSARKAQDTP